MLFKMRRVLLAVDFRNRFKMGRRVTVGEIAKAANMSRSTVHRYMVKACGLGLVETHQFEWNKRPAYEFELTIEGQAFLDAWIGMFE